MSKLEYSHSAQATSTSHSTSVKFRECLNVLQSSTNQPLIIFRQEGSPLMSPPQPPRGHDTPLGSAKTRSQAGIFTPSRRPGGENGDLFAHLHFSVPSSGGTHGDLVEDRLQTLTIMTVGSLSRCSVLNGRRNCQLLDGNSIR